MKKNQLNELEDLFQDSLKNFSVNARGDNWSKIDETLNELDVNDTLKDKFVAYKSVPASHQKNTLLNELESRFTTIFYTKRIAAAAIILVACLFFFDNASQNKEATFAISFPTLSTDALAYEVCKDPELSSLDIVKTEVKSIRKKKRDAQKNPAKQNNF